MYVYKRELKNATLRSFRDITQTDTILILATIYGDGCTVVKVRPS